MGQRLHDVEPTAVTVATPPSNRFRHLADLEDVGGTHEGHMRERLREIAHHPSGAVIVFLRQQANIIGNAAGALVIRSHRRMHGAKYSA